MKLLLLTLIIISLGFSKPLSLPDSNKTPGDCIIGVMLHYVCNNYLEIKFPSATIVRIVFNNYDIPIESLGYDYKLDHLIPMELGGSNDIRNLWPLTTTGQWTFKKKKLLEKRLVWLACNGKISLREAQEILAKNWIDAYKIYMYDTTLQEKY